MAVRACAIVQDGIRNVSDNTKIDPTVKCIIIGSDLGDLENPEQTITPEGLAIGVLSAFNAAVADACQAFMESHGIVFQIGDTVWVVGS